MERIALNVTKSDRGKDNIVLNGYLYAKSKSYESRVYWNCDEKSSKNCNGRLVTDFMYDKYYFVKDSEHNHESDPMKEVISDVNSEAKRLANDSRDKPIVIRRRVQSNIPMNCPMPIISDNALTQRIQYARNSKRATERTELNFNIPVTYNVSLNGDQFLRDYFLNDKRIYLFVTNDGL